MSKQESVSVRERALDSLREIVFGLEDGVVSTLGAVTGIAIGTGDPFIVILSGVVVIFVESLSMASGTFLSSKSEAEVLKRKVAAQRALIEQSPEEARVQLQEAYTARGFTPEEQTVLLDRITDHPDTWLEDLSHKQLGIIPDQEFSPVRDALFMGVSYIIGGTISIILYFFLPLSSAIPGAIALSVVALFIVGYVKGALVQVPKVRSGIEMMIVSITAAGLGYAVARIVSALFEVNVVA